MRAWPENIQPVTLKHELHALQKLPALSGGSGSGDLRAHVLRVDELGMGPRLPRDAPLEQLRRLLTEIEKAIIAPRARVQRMAVMDRAWFLLNAARRLAHQ